MLSEAEVAPHIAERCLGHVRKGVEKTYDRWEFFKEKRDAFEKLAALVADILAAESNVKTLRRA